VEQVNQELPMAKQLFLEASSRASGVHILKWWISSLILLDVNRP
jgi:hypothetical protein